MTNIECMTMRPEGTSTTDDAAGDSGGGWCKQNQRVTEKQKRYIYVTTTTTTTNITTPVAYRSFPLYLLHIQGLCGCMYREGKTATDGTEERRGASPETMRPLTSVTMSGHSTIANSDSSLSPSKLPRFTLSWSIGALVPHIPSRQKQKRQSMMYFTLYRAIIFNSLFTVLKNIYISKIQKKNGKKKQRKFL